MSQVVAGVTAKLQDLLPGQVGVTWPTATVSVLAQAADAAFKERIGHWYVTQEIDLVADTLVYDLDSKFIRVKSVEFSSDGTNYDDHLSAVSLDDLDIISLDWRDDRGTRPEFYTLLSCPGIYNDGATHANGSEILIYRALSAVSSQKIKVIGTGLGAVTDQVPSEVLDACHVPYVLSLLMVHEDVAAAQDYMAEYEYGVREASKRYTNPYSQSPVR